MKSPSQVKASREQDPEFLESTVRSIRVIYETRPALAAAVLPRPLEPAERPEVCVTFSHVAMHVTPEHTFEIGSAIFGVRAVYDGTPGVHLLTMPMTAEQAVIGGRETYGEPKKIASIDFRAEGEEVASTVTRMGIPYLSFRGRLGASLGPRDFTEHGFCYKALPSCEKERDFDGDPLLVRLDWRHRHRRVHRVEGELVLGESPFDPVADLPVVGGLRAEYEEGTSESSGRVLRAVPGEWLLPFLHGRYDDPTHPGIDVPTPEETS
ncbi:MAG: acetoacetate decarboxylase family protein [Myxococcota bacterium]|nr:acetoacetate decarboxylase family protein [Myxococcota bacterium]